MLPTVSSATVLLAADGAGHGPQDVPELGWVGAVLVGVLALAGAVFILVSAVAMYLAPDALSQVNMLGPAMGVGVPLLIISHLVYSWATVGFVAGEFLRAVVAVAALLVVQSVGSYVMGGRCMPCTGTTPSRCPVVRRTPRSDPDVSAPEPTG